MLPSLKHRIRYPSRLCWHCRKSARRANHEPPLKTVQTNPAGLVPLVITPCASPIRIRVSCAELLLSPTYAPRHQLHVRAHRLGSPLYNDHVHARIRCISERNRTDAWIDTAASCGLKTSSLILEYDGRPKSLYVIPQRLRNRIDQIE